MYPDIKTKVDSYKNNVKVTSQTLYNITLGKIEFNKIVTGEI